METTSILDDIVPKFRRAIDDIEEPYCYADTALAEYIEDSISQSWLEWRHNYTFDRETHLTNIEITEAHQMFFVMYAKLEMMKRQPDISFRSGSMSVTRKSDNKKMLQEKVDEVINDLIAFECIGLVNSDLTRYARRLEDWMFIQTL